MTHDHAQLLQHLKTSGVLHTPAVIAAFSAIDRGDFVLDEYRDIAYEDAALPIGFGQTISQPYTVAYMLEMLGAKAGDRILDVGSGSGFTTALLAHIAGNCGVVFGVEIIPELVAFSQENLAKYSFKKAEVVQASYDQIGLEIHASYDRILVSAGDTEVPQTLLTQLTVGGIMVIPVEDALWKIARTSKTKTMIEKHEGFVFVPLVYEHPSP